MLASLRARPEWAFFLSLSAAQPALALAWWGVLILRGLLPAAFAVVAGALVGAVQRGEDPQALLWLLAGVFLPLQVLPPLHQVLSANLGTRTSEWLNDRLVMACVRPPGMGHLESPELTSDLSMARDFDLGISGPPMAISMDFIASGLMEMAAGLAATAVVAAYAWWAAVLLAGSWLATHWLLRESSVWRDRNTEEVRQAQRQADYAYRLAVEPHAAKELRLFGLAGWTVERFRASRRRLFQLRWEATRLREQPLLWSVLLVLAANLVVFLSVASAAANGTLPLDRAVTFTTAAALTSLIAFGGLSWALDGAAAPVAAVLRLQQAMAPAGGAGCGQPTGRWPAGTRDPLPQPDVRLPGYRRAGPARFRFDDPGRVVAGDRWSERRGQDHAGEAALPALRSPARCHRGRWRRSAYARPRRLAARVTAVFQDFIRFELPLRDNVAPAGAPDDAIRAALADAGAAKLAGLETVLAKGYEGGTDLSGGQWQRVALARALCAVRQGAGLVLLDEPTAQLDVRGEAEIFDRILAATRHTTTILISHRFSTVRHADRICVLEGGRVIELGSHDELMALGGRYRTMFELQASRFGSETIEEGEETSDDLLS